MHLVGESFGSSFLNQPLRKSSHGCSHVLFQSCDSCCKHKKRIHHVLFIQAVLIQSACWLPVRSADYSARVFLVCIRER